MVYRVENREFASGDRVRLGNGETGQIKGQEDRNGITGYRVTITDGPRKGDVVGASPAGMVKLGSQQCTRTAVTIGDRSFMCKVAATAAAHAQGLQDTEPLPPDEGMLFTFDPPRAATFHMGTVSYPIDIVFIDPKQRVAKVVRNAQPGSKGQWGYTYCSAVLEVAGGCAGVSPGALVKTAAAPSIVSPNRYNISFPEEVDEIGNRSPAERYKERGTPDDASPDADEMSNKHWEQNFGYDPVKWPDGDGPPLRPTAQRIADPSDFIVTMIEAMARHERPLDWHRDALNPKLAYATFGPDDITHWLSHYDMAGSAATDVLEVATSKQGLSTLGDGLVLAGVADIAHVASGPHNQDMLVLWTSHEDFTNEPESKA